TKFARRLLENGYTHELLQSIENNERDENKFKNKFLNEMKEILKTQEKLEIEKIKRVIKETEEKKKIMAKNGISDSIKTCFAMINSICLIKRLDVTFNKFEKNYHFKRMNLVVLWNFTEICSLC
ncbi:hypothetical protein BpHYR1_001933, partial [Brachionus plicatilis]